jgi:hypothetical protein
VNILEYKESNQTERILLMLSRFTSRGYRETLHPIVPTEYFDLLTAHHSNAAAWFLGQVND